LHQDGVVLLPDHLSYEEGATLPVRQSQLGTHWCIEADSRRNLLLLGTGEFRFALHLPLLENNYLQQ